MASVPARVGTRCEEYIYIAMLLVHDFVFIVIVMADEK
jgi:hypothetical protein